MFGVMIWMWTDKFGEIWSDSFAFYNFTAKSSWDLLEFWLLFGAMAFFHETAHGLTCKHFGARVEGMQFLLMYFAPTFMCDCTQVWIVGDKKARISTIIAGIWGDLMICVVATFIWWGTATGMWVHDFAYKVMMVTGIGVTILNLNPLIKLDGYYLLSELINETGLKEESTVYVSSWVRKHIFRLPAEVTYVPRHRRVLYIVYSVLSGVYSYLLIAVVVVFVYHILLNYTPEWAWLPALLLGFQAFQVADRHAGAIHEKCLPRQERTSARLVHSCPRCGFRRRDPGDAFCAPVAGICRWPLRTGAAAKNTGPHRSPGTVAEVLSDEGQSVAAGAPLLRLRNLELESAAALAGADLRNASARAVRAGMSYENFGPAEHERQQSTRTSTKLRGGDQTSRSYQPHRRHRHHPPVARSAGHLLESRNRGRRGGRLVHHEGPHLHSGIQHAGCSPGCSGAPPCRVTVPAVVRNPGIAGACVLPDREQD